MNGLAGGWPHKRVWESNGHRTRAREEGQHPKCQEGGTAGKESLHGLAVDAGGEELQAPWRWGEKEGGPWEQHGRAGRGREGGGTAGRAEGLGREMGSHGSRALSG